MKPSRGPRAGAAGPAAAAVVRAAAVAATTGIAAIKRCRQNESALRLIPHLAPPRKRGGVSGVPVRYSRGWTAADMELPLTLNHLNLGPLVHRDAAQFAIGLGEMHGVHADEIVGSAFDRQSGNEDLNRAHGAFHGRLPGACADADRLGDLHFLAWSEF